MKIKKELFKGIYKQLNNNDRIIYALIRAEKKIKTDEYDNRYIEIPVMYLADYAGIDDTTCRRCLDKLEGVGLIHYIHGSGRGYYGKIYFDKFEIPQQAEEIIINCIKKSKFGTLTAETIRRYTNMSMLMINATLKTLIDKKIVKKYKNSYEFLSNM